MDGFWLLCGDFIFDVVGQAYDVKIDARFYKVWTYEMRCGELCICDCIKFLGVSFCEELAKFDDMWLIYNKYKKGDVFSEKQCSHWNELYLSYCSQLLIQHQQHTRGQLAVSLRTEFPAYQWLRCFPGQCSWAVSTENGWGTHCRTWTEDGKASCDQQQARCLV